MLGKEVIKAQTGTVDVQTLIPEEIEKQNKEQRLMTVGMAPHHQFDIIRVNSINEFYWKEKDGVLFRPLDKHTLEVWVRDLWLGYYGAIKPKDLTDGCEMVKILTKNEVNDLSSDCIMISENLYWDKQLGEVVRTPSNLVFYRLFDTDAETDKIVKTPPFTPEQEEIFWKRYEEVRDELQRGEEVERYEFLKTWANGSHDIYMDLQRSHAYMFLRRKPLGSYVLIGIRRNGKSTFLNLTHSIIGTNNSSMVKLSQLDNDHYTHELVGSLMNAPDEEKDEALKGQDIFKSLADHGTVPLSVMGSNKPVKLNCDFMCFFPMNHTPEWKGSGAGACMNRSLIIPFNADLSEFDKTSSNFMKDTFTPDVMADYLGSVFAYAWWFHRHDFEFSETMKTEQGVLEQDLDSCLTYYKHFTKYFDGFQSFKVVYTDYQFWCQVQDIKINTRKELKFVFRQMCNSKTSWRHPVKKEVKQVCRVPKPGHQPLMNDFWCKELGYIEELHEKTLSVVDRLDTYYQDKMNEESNEFSGFDI